MLLALIMCVAIVAAIVFGEKVLKSYQEEDWWGFAVSAVYGVIVIGLTLVVAIAIS